MQIWWISQQERLRFQISCTLNTMLDFIRRHNVHDSTVRLLPFIILLSVFIPVLLYLNAKSITLYLTTIKLHDTFETAISDTSELLHGCGAEVMSIKMSTDSLAGSQIFSLFIKNSNCTERHPSQLWGLAVGYDMHFFLEHHLKIKKLRKKIHKQRI
jgi:hypothetical protein